MTPRTTSRSGLTFRAALGLTAGTCACGNLLKSPVSPDAAPVCSPARPSPADPGRRRQLPADGGSGAQATALDANALDVSAADFGPPPVDGLPAPKPRVILVSVDGLGATYLQQQLAQGRLPSLAAVKRAGASTLNARADCAYTDTLPNHTSILTGRPVSADPALPDTAYHGWTGDGQVPATTTLHNAGNPHLDYVASVFDVIHDHGGSTCLYSGKAKFNLYANSYNSKNGALDAWPPDDGRNKIDRVTILEDGTESLISSLEADLAGSMCDLAFVHIADTDLVGHNSGWGSDAWLSTLAMVDGWLGRLAVFADPLRASEPSYLIVTADHGGAGNGHSDPSMPADFTIPFFVVGPGIPANVDLYSLTATGRADPGVSRPRYSEPWQPVRNADAANLVTTLMGLPSVPGSFMRDLLKSNPRPSRPVSE